MNLRPVPRPPQAEALYCSLTRWAHLQRQGITAVRLAAAFGRGAKGSGFFLQAPDGLTVRAPGMVVGAILLLGDIAKSLGHIDRPLAMVV